MEKVLWGLYLLVAMIFGNSYVDKSGGGAITKSSSWEFLFSRSLLHELLSTITILTLFLELLSKRSLLDDCEKDWELK